jgi:hypothetical protein
MEAVMAEDGASNGGAQKYIAEQDIAAISATLLQGLVVAIASVWQYYFSVVIGLVAAIAVLASTSVSVSPLAKGAVTVVVLLFEGANFHSLRSLTKQVNQLQRSIADRIRPATPREPLAAALSEPLQEWPIYLALIGLIAVLVFFWLFDFRPRTHA